jgi:hypothetical protein
MDIQNKIEQELVFKIEIKDQYKKIKIRQRKVIKTAEENMVKMAMDRLDGKTGEC